MVADLRGEVGEPSLSRRVYEQAAKAHPHQLRAKLPLAVLAYQLEGRPQEKGRYVVVRASAGSIFRVPVIRRKLDAVSSQLRAQEIRLVATSSHKGTPLGEARLTGALAMFIGNEGSGLPRDLMTRMDEVVVIPHAPQVESLNAGVATSILLYEAARQRK